MIRHGAQRGEKLQPTTLLRAPNKAIDGASEAPYKPANPMDRRYGAACVKLAAFGI